MAQLSSGEKATPEDIDKKQKSFKKKKKKSGLKKCACLYRPLLCLVQERCSPVKAESPVIQKTCLLTPA